MIRVSFTPRRVTIDGHADMAPRGQDIVCAAVSALVYALAGTLEQRGTVSELVIRPGHVTLAATEEDSAFDVVRCGLQQLAARYPMCVKVE